jgi:antitoxin HicB
MVHSPFLYPAPEGGYVAEVPSLPGFLAQGETIAECMAELEIVATQWMEAAEQSGQPLPSAEAAIERMRTWSLAG